VTAVVANPKLVPSRTAIDVKNKISPPEVVTIEGDALEVITGLTAGEPFFEKAREQKRRPASMRVDTIPGRGAVYVRWFVRGKPPYTVTVRSSKGGTARRESDSN
ncbi:MAG: peptidase M14, partial [Planctomycetes bacterium]|nr:peptidase M14 [Planctomycetota bacterium]